MINLNYLYYLHDFIYFYWLYFKEIIIFNGSMSIECHNGDVWLINPCAVRNLWFGLTGISFKCTIGGLMEEKFITHEDINCILIETTEII